MVREVWFILKYWCIVKFMVVEMKNVKIRSVVISKIFIVIKNL